MTTELKNGTVQQEPQEELLSLEAAAEFLCVSKPTLYRMLDRGEVKGIKVGRQWRFKKSDLDAYLSRGPVAMALAAVPMELVDAELDFFAGELEKLGASVPESQEEDDDPYEQKIKLLVMCMTKLAKCAKASDIHIEPMKEDGDVFGLLRFRIDGVLQEVRRMSPRLMEALILRCRQLSDGESSERTIWFDDHIRLYDGEDTLEFRISIIPGSLGSSLSGRLLVKSPVTTLGLDDLGFYQEDLVRVRQWIRKPSGIVLVTGPVGCGKTTLLYKMLQDIASPNKLVVTIEDPVESQLPWVSQFALRPGMSFGNTLRAFMRHDPDVVMISELRDLETMAIGVNIAHMGHLVMAPVHVNNTIRAVQRYLEVFPDNQKEMITMALINGLNGVVSERLARVLCPHCKTPAQLSAEVLSQARQLAAEGGYEIPEDAVFYHPVGCEKCSGIGYQGRTGVFELLEFTPELRQAFMQSVPYEELLALAVKGGMRTLEANYIRKAAEGVTTLENVLQV